MEVNTHILENLFNKFKKFVEDEDKKPFTKFSKSGFFVSQENYKYSIHERAQTQLNTVSWNKTDIGKGLIQKKISNAFKAKPDTKRYPKSTSNLTYHQGKEFDSIAISKSLETTLFQFFKSNSISAQSAFENFEKEKLNYQSIAYLFFIKDLKNYMPITQKKFDVIFEIIGLPEFKTERNISWANYQVYNYIIKQVRDFLLTKDNEITLLDAHSFLYILGKQMHNAGVDLFQKEHQPGIQKELINGINTHPEVEYEPEQTIAEEEDNLAFPEGKEIYRLHKSKERNKELIRIVKRKHLESDPKLCCRVCNFSFIEAYGALGEGFIEAHHVFPISELQEETETKVEDIVLVCSNCHRMLHRKRPWLKHEDLKDLIQSVQVEAH